jgi:TRAP transporter TAXI family solute receptor
MNSSHLLLAAAVAVLLVASPAAERGGIVAIGTNPPGSVFYAVGAGLAKTVSAAGSIRMTVQPYTGSSSFAPFLNDGELEFGVVNAVDMALSYRGPGYTIGGRNPLHPTPDVRLVMRGSPLLVALLVRRDSPIRSIADIRGRRLTGGYPAHISVWYNMFGMLASAGLTWDDVTVVPVPGINEGIDALVQGRADISEFAIGGAKVKEADAAVGVRHISMDCSPQGEARIRSAVPGYYPRMVKKGVATGVAEDTCVVAYDLYLATSLRVPDEIVYGALDAIWNGADALPRLHPVFREWTRARAISTDVTIPYHGAAVRFFRDRGVWSSDMERAQAALLAVRADPRLSAR